MTKPPLATKLLSDLVADSASQPVILLADSLFSKQQWQQLSGVNNLLIVSNNSNNITMASNYKINYLADNFKQLPNATAIYFLLNKQKILNKYWLRYSLDSLNILDAKSKIKIYGLKQQGLKSYYSYCKQTLENSALLKKTTLDITIDIFSEIKKTNNKDLAEDDYFKPIQLCFDDHKLQSQPGVFGYNKIDSASKLLIDYLSSCELKKQKSILDLGCGYGYLAVNSINIFKPSSITVIDNNLLATQLCKTNIINSYRNKHIELKVLWQSATEPLTEKFDYIICNPPFHSNFDNDYNLTTIFIKQIANSLKTTGKAFVVTNQFIAIAKNVAQFKLKSQLVVNTNGFKVWVLSK